MEEIDNSIRQYNDYRANASKEYKFVHHYFVAEKGFADNALGAAFGNGIICYEKRNGKFRRVRHSGSAQMIA